MKRRSSAPPDPPASRPRSPIPFAPRRLGKAVGEARTAIGDRRAVAVKTRRAWATLRAFVDRAEKERRLEELRRRGRLEEFPNDWQLLVGSYRMFVDFLIPASAKLYDHTGKSFTWQQILRFLDEPCAVMDPTGLTAPEESILSHLIQVSHHEAVYDVELLEMFPGGVDRLIEEVRQLVAGTHPRQAAIDTIVEHPEYHERLLVALERYREDPVEHAALEVFDPPPGGEAEFAAGEIYATPGSFFTYCTTMPATPAATARAVVRGRRAGRSRSRRSGSVRGTAPDGSGPGGGAAREAA